MSNNLEMAIGEKIKSFRNKREITQEQLAAYLNISFQSVSKWECGDAYPDITMLPKIAMFFGITTDELLCIDKLKEQEEIEEYIKQHYKALSIGHTQEAVAIMREANTKYPSNFRIMSDLANAIQTNAIALCEIGHQQGIEYQQQSWKEIISIGEKIIRECRDHQIRQSIIQVMVSSYKHLNEIEKAKKLINENLSGFWASNDKMLENVLEDEELVKQRQQNIVTLLPLFTNEMYYLSENFSKEEKLIINENIIKIYSMIFADGDYGVNNIPISGRYIDIMNIYLELGNNEKFLENLKKVSELSINYDNLPEQFIHTSPLVNKLSAGKTIKRYKGNQTYNLLKRLNEEKYNGIRDTLEFKEICEELKKYSKEDE